ncbi:hypothetical protein IMX26_14395 [Clostridium sp. 'deep sea']|uniref:hypothetical protein n=1 Tax=Clostridium sp. 'deep sea' TaxID=2779445 RepID=UPI001896859A|nr:hypothetical protein [Clostridium sp. 'deep sea']QOR34647.1 hypothetical protein IMX26_14395 [Clostridium sp. 'deep sea']
MKIENETCSIGLNYHHAEYLNNLEYNKFIQLALQIATYIDSHQQEPVSKTRIVRNCIAQVIPPLKVAKTSVSDVAKYEYMSVSSYYNLNLYNMLLDFLLGFYISSTSKIKMVIKPQIIECINIIQAKISHMEKITDNSKLLNMPNLTLFFNKYGSSINDFKSLLVKSNSLENNSISKLKKLHNNIKMALTNLFNETKKTSPQKIKSLKDKANDFFDDWEKSQDIDDAKEFVENTSNIITGVMELGTLIAGSKGNKELEETLNCTGVIVGATLNVGLALISCCLGPFGVLGILGVASSLVGGVTSITSYFVNKDKKSPEEIIIDQIAQLGKMIEQNFKYVYKYLSSIETTMIEKFIDLKYDLKNIDKNIDEIKSMLDTMFDILLDEEYFNNRNKMLTYHENFDTDMPYDMQVNSFFNFVNCCTVKSKNKSKHLADGITYCINGIKEKGIDFYIPFLAEYANMYLCNIKLCKEYISPMYWGEGCLSLVEFILRNPEFKTIPKQKETFNEIMQLGSDVIELTEQLYNKKVLEKIILRYIDCIENYLPELAHLDLLKVDSKYVNEYLENVTKAIEQVKKSGIIQQLNEYCILVKAYFKLIHNDAYINNIDVIEALSNLCSGQDLLDYLNDIIKYINNNMFSINKEYDKLVVSQAGYTEQITLFIKNKYGVWKRLQYIKEESKRNCRKLITYSKAPKESIGDLLTKNILSYLLRFSSEFYGTESASYKSAQNNVLDYNFIDFGNVLDFNSKINFDNKELKIIGNGNAIVKCLSKDSISSWQVLDGSWHTPLERSNSFSILFNLNNTNNPLYFRLNSRFINMDNEGYFNRHVSLVLTNDLGSYVIADQYRPETFINNEKEQITCFNGCVVNSKLKNPFFSESVFVIPAENLCEKNNEISVVTKKELMIQNIEIATAVFKQNDCEYALSIPNSKLYLTIEEYEKGKHRVNFTPQLDEKCYFKIEYKPFTNYIQLYSTYLNDYVISTNYDTKQWDKELNLCPLNEVKEQIAKTMLPEILRNPWLYLITYEANKFAIIVPKFRRKYLDNSFGYLCKNKNKNKYIFAAEEHSICDPLYIELEEK